MYTSLDSAYFSVCDTRAAFSLLNSRIFAIELGFRMKALELNVKTASDTGKRR